MWSPKCAVSGDLVFLRPPSEDRCYSGNTHPGAPYIDLPEENVLSGVR